MSVSKTLGTHGSNDYGCRCVLLDMQKTLTHMLITIVIVHVEKVMALVLLCESAEQLKVLMMILQYHKTLTIISMMIFQCPISFVSETSQVLSPCNPYISPFNSQKIYHKVR